MINCGISSSSEWMDEVKGWLSKCEMVVDIKTLTMTYLLTMPKATVMRQWLVREGESVALRVPHTTIFTGSVMEAGTGAWVVGELVEAYLDGRLVTTPNGLCAALESVRAFTQRENE